MKKVAVISLIAVFFITQHTYASCLLEECSKAAETSPYQESTQEEIEKPLIEIAGSADWEKLGHIQQNPTLCRMLSALVYFSLLAYPLSPSDATFNYVVNIYMTYLVLCGSRFSVSPQFGSIAPSQGRQEEILTITITCINTTFQDDGINDIFFSPPDGIFLENIRVESNTSVEFDLIIEADAPVGSKTVTVIWDNGNKFVTGVNVFEVVPAN